MASIDETKGKIKEAAGDLTGDKDLKNEGKVDQASGKVKDAVYKVKDAHNSQQHFTVDDDLGWNQDPGTWATGVFVR